MAEVGAYEAKTHLPKLLERVKKGESITITKHGVPVAILSPPVADRSEDVRTVIDKIRTLREQIQGHEV